MGGCPRLKAAFQTLEHTSALKDGTVRPQGFELQVEEVTAIIHAFRRMVRGLEFDVSEMALTTYLSARAHHKAFTALPIFLVRAFHHGAIFYNKVCGSADPRDLEGKQVGVNRGYTVTTGVWARGILQHEYGVDLSRITWVLSGDEHVEEFQAPSNVIRLEPGRTLEQALVAGQLAAAIGIQSIHPDIAPLIPDPQEAGFHCLARNGHYPINHLLVVRDSVLAVYPDLPVALFEAFAVAKRPYLERLRAAAIAAPTQSDQMYRRVLDITGTDPLPYGVEPNRCMLETLIGYAQEQRIVSRPYEVDELFARDTLAMTG
jgi:4,5-dihydroxyphthalate decarboxylase